MAAQHLEHAPRLLTEWYRPHLTEEPLGQTARRIDHAARETSAGRVELLQTIFLPDDEVAFCLFAAESPELVAHVCHRAQLLYDRITEAIEANPLQPRQPT